MPGKEPKDDWRVLIVVAQILIPGAIVLVGLVLTKPYDRWLIAALAVGVAATTSLAMGVGMGRHYVRQLREVVSDLEVTFADRMADIARMAMMRADAREGWTQEKLSRYEGSIDVKTVWIVGADFDTEINFDAPFLEVVKRNIHERGVKYVYIAPDNTALHYTFNRLRTELGLSEDDERLETFFLGSQQWEQMPYPVGNFTIYDPVRKGHRPQGYCWDPGGDGSSFIELRHNVGGWVGKIQKICPQLDHGGELDNDDPTTGS